MQPFLGGGIREMLFENITPATLKLIKDKIKTTIELYEPRAELIDISVKSNIDDNVVSVIIQFYIINRQQPITLDVISDLKYADCDTIIIQFSTFSDDTYSYYNSLGDHREKGELSIFGGEVIPVYSNVENGLGVLISTNAQQIYLKP